jgi:hypothetical protein
LIDNVSTLTITGGEPTLAMDSLEHLRHRIIYENCDVANFYLVTNGKSINIDRTAEWINNMHNCCSDNDISGVGFSFDDFHTSTFNWNQLEKRNRNYQTLKDVIECEYGIIDSANHSFIYKHSDEKLTYDRLLQEGRAEDFGSIKNSIEFFTIDEDENRFCLDEGVLYLSCTGHIVAGCNWSYNSIDNNEDIRIAHIDDLDCTDDLIEAIRAYNKKVEESDAARVAKHRANRKLQEA